LHQNRSVRGLFVHGVEFNRRRGPRRPALRRRRRN
jgi:hypothetical protein